MNVYFTDGPMLEYEQMMQQIPRGRFIVPVSSSSLPLPGMKKKEPTEKEVMDDECGK